MYLWRAVDSEGEVLDILVQSRRNKKAALKLMRKLLKKQGYAPNMGVMGGPVGGAMTAEDVRHLQGRAHGGHSSRRHHLQGQAVDRAPRLGNGGRRHLRIAGRRRQAVVAQKHLDDADVDAALEQLGRPAERADIGPRCTSSRLPSQKRSKATGGRVLLRPRLGNPACGSHKSYLPQKS